MSEAVQNRALRVGSCVKTTVKLRKTKLYHNVPNLVLFKTVDGYIAQFYLRVPDSGGNYVPRKKEVLPMAWKQLLQSSYTVLSPAARMTNIPSLEICWLPATGASRKRPPRDLIS